ncbi:MAG: 2-hydroxyacid dehydrogenase [Anaerolineae bacterium]
MQNPKVALFSAKPYDKEFFTLANKHFQFEIKYFDAHLNLDTCSLAQNYDAISIFVNDTLSAEMIDRLHHQGVKLIALRSAGFNHVDLKAAKGKIHVVRVPDYSPYAVAEHAIAMMLTLNRKIYRAYWRVRDNNFNIDGLLGFDMHGKTAGVIGVGRIGQQVIKILQGFGMKVIAYDIDPKQVEKARCPFAPLDTLYRDSDIITLHCPLTPDNLHMINRDSLPKMKQGVMLINTGRGGLIDSRALIDALKTNKVSAAGLDVYEEESRYFYEDLSQTFISDDVLARLQTFPNVLITSHQGFFTREALYNIAMTTLENIKVFCEGKPLQNEISD